MEKTVDQHQGNHPKYKGHERKRERTRRKYGIRGERAF